MLKVDMFEDLQRLGDVLGVHVHALRDLLRRSLGPHLLRDSQHVSRGLGRRPPPGYGGCSTIGGCGVRFRQRCSRKGLTVVDGRRWGLSVIDGRLWSGRRGRGGCCLSCR